MKWRLKMFTSVKCPMCYNVHQVNIKTTSVHCICGADMYVANYNIVRTTLSYNNKDLMKRETMENNQFIKADSGKTRVSLVEPDFIKGVADILTFGATKYEANNWKKLPTSELYRYKDALMRHLLQYLSGEYLDVESGKPHLDHVACNIMFLKHFEEKVVKQTPKQTDMESN